MKLTLLISRLAIICLCAVSMSCSSFIDSSSDANAVNADELSFGF